MNAKNMIKLTAILAVASSALFGVTGCYKYIPAQSQTPTTNPQIEVQLVLEHDGVKVYRFWDGVRTIYYTDARGNTAWDEVRSTGKTTYTEHHDVETAK